MKDLGEGMKELKAIATPWEEQHYQSSQGRNQQPKNMNGGAHGSSSVCGSSVPGINVREGPWSCGGLKPQHKGMLQLWGRSEWWLEKHPHRDV